jgi:hypothetical protein
MIGSRREDAAHYPVNEVAARYDASVTKATDEPAEAYADWRREPRRRTRNPWPLQSPRRPRSHELAATAALTLPI